MEGQKRLFRRFSDAGVELDKPSVCRAGITTHYTGTGNEKIRLLTADDCGDYSETGL
jgi:hypothetical protein